MKIIGDPGSCHLGSLEKAKELVKIGAYSGLDAVKFQLLTSNETKNGNIGMDWDWLPELIDLGKSLKVEVFASVFDKSGIEWLKHCGCESIKFSYSQKSAFVERPDFRTVYVSCAPMTYKTPLVTNLYCIPEYPVRYMVDFEGLFPTFAGFSSHCLGIEQDIRAVEAGARVIEKHFQGNWDSPCPDGNFALKPNQLAELVRRCRATAGRPESSKRHPDHQSEGLRSHQTLASQLVKP